MLEKIVETAAIVFYMTILHTVRRSAANSAHLIVRHNTV